ncbi:carboxypeptidase-like regulatory domain-containing protein [Flavobacterium sp. HNIBRBA15423]|uniref:carboxypeptidase-like regulatory domain-containing protein n=1 Tax=Flavobacterium sp. HNIBRBA15423 TaxID=3458683 RepID=UPI004044AA76
MNKYIFILLFINSISFSQVLKGTVSDSAGVVPFANVLIKEKNNLISQFTTTNSNGNYKILLKKNKDSLFIEVSGISHEPKTISLKDYISNNNEINIDFKLENRTTKLKEVIVEKKISISIKKDTLTYNPESFKDGSEKIVEDLLRKLPGIIVKDDGAIEYKGKKIKKMLLDGDDLFDSQYTIGSKNISVGMIDKVQGIDNYEENTLLKGISSSEDVAINLVLKKGKTDFSGNTNLGYGYKNVHDTNINGLAINNKIKGFGISSFNNVGQNNTPYNFDSEIISLESQKNSNLLAKELINQGNFYSFLDNSFHRLNNNFYTSLNLLTKVYKKSNLKINAGFHSDNLKRINENESSVTIINETFTINENNIIQKKPTLFDFNLSFLNKEKEKFHWNYLGKINYQKTNYNDVSTNNSFVQENNITTKSFLLNQNLSSTYKFSDSTAVTSTFIYSKNKAPQNLFINPGTLINVDNSVISKYQTSTFNKENINLNSSLLNTRNKIKFGIHTSFLKMTSSLNSSLNNELNNSIGDNYKNDNKYDVLYFKMNPVFVFNDKKYAFKIGLNTFYNNISFNNYIKNTKLHEDDLLISPSLTFLYRFNKKNNTSFKYSFNQILPEEDKLFDGIVQRNYRSFATNEFSFQYLKTHSYILNYSFNDFFNLQQLSINLSHDYRENNYFYKSVIDQNITISNSYYANTGNKDYGVNLFGETYFHPLRTTIQINTNYSLSFDKNIINDSSLRNILGKTFYSQLTARTSFKSKINFSNKISFLNNSFEVKKETTKNNFSSLTDQFKIMYRNNAKNFKVDFVSNFISPDLNQNNNYLFLETEINYTPKNKKISYSIIGKNLTNNKTFETKSVSDYSSSISSHNLISTYLMLKVTSGF